MDAAELNKLQHNVLIRFNQLGLLSDKLNTLLADEVQTYRARLKSISSDPLFQEELPEEAHLPLGKLRELRKTEPEKVQRIIKQIQLQSEHSGLNLDIMLTEQIFPSLTFSSLAMMAFAMFDESLSLVCSAISEIRGHKLKLNDLSGHSTIEKTQQYVTKVASLQYDFANSSDWQRIRGHYDVRNLLAHNGGVLDQSDRANKVKIFIQSKQTVLKIQSGGLQIGREYIEELINDLQQWMLSIFDLL